MSDGHHGDAVRCRRPGHDPRRRPARQGRGGLRSRREALRGPRHVAARRQRRHGRASSASEVFSPVTDPGMVDHLVAFEIIEAMRRVHYVKPEGRLLVNRARSSRCRCSPASCRLPHGLQAILEDEGAIFIDADELACEAGSPEVGERRADGRLVRGACRSAKTCGARSSPRACRPRPSRPTCAAFELGREACRRGECAL